MAFAMEITQSKNEIVDTKPTAVSFPLSTDTMLADHPSPHNINRTHQRQRMQKEAQQVIEATGGSTQLDGFNLLGVVADPRVPGSQLAGSLPNSYHGRYNIQTTPESTGSTFLFGSTGASYYQSFESTLSQMTGQMEAFNSVLEDWSRFIVEENDIEHEITQSQLKELPPEIANVDRSTIEVYLNRCGVQADAFHLIRTNEGEEFDRNYRAHSSRSLSGGSSGDDDIVEDLVDVSEIPETFFDPNFDLTHPITFQKMLLLDSDGRNFASNGQEDTSGPVPEWFLLLPPDALGGHLDKVELALLQQVRTNSGQFFAESQRFAQLQEWIQSMLQDVMELLVILKHLNADLLQPMQTVPVADAQRADLRKLELVLECAEDLILCKHSLGGVLSAQDDLTAIEQISYGRRLLEGTTKRNYTEDEVDYPFETIQLCNLHSFKSVPDQLNQYEQLVVSNLRDEVVETFLSWNSTSAAALYGSSSVVPSQQEHVHSRVRDIMRALKDCKALSKTRDAYTMRLQDVARMTVRTIVGEFAADVTPNGAVQSVAMSTSSMTLSIFMECLDMLFEQLLSLLKGASSVDSFLVFEGMSFQDETILDREQDHRSETKECDDQNTLSPLTSAMISSAELMSKSISELLRIRKDAHALISLTEMKSVWDTCTRFASELEKLSGSGHTSTLQSTLLAQAKLFVERTHESHMSSLAAALESEKWVQCEISAERQESLTRLCSGLTVLSSMKGTSVVDTTVESATVKKCQEIEVEGTRYKVVWSCMLLVNMVLTDIATATHFSSLSSNIVGKISDLMRLFNSRTTQLVLGAGAIHSHAKLKSINAKHLCLVTQCLGMLLAILPHIRAALMSQLTKKQYTLLTALDQIRKEYGEHNEKVLNKFVSIIGGIIEHGLAKKIAETNFDARSQFDSGGDMELVCCAFLEGVSTNTKKMHQVLLSMLPPDHLKDTFSRIFAFIDTKVPALFIAAANIQPVFQKPSVNHSLNSPPKTVQPSFLFPSTDEGKRRFLLEVEATVNHLNGLPGVHPWEFTMTNVLERRLGFSLSDGPIIHLETGPNNGVCEEDKDITPELLVDLDTDNIHVSLDNAAKIETPGSTAEHGEGNSMSAQTPLANNPEVACENLPKAGEGTLPGSAAIENGTGKAEDA